MSANQEKTISPISHFKNIFLILIFNVILTQFFILLFALITSFLPFIGNIWIGFFDFLTSILVIFVIFSYFPKVLFSEFDRIKANNLILIYNFCLICFLIILTATLFIFPNSRVIVNFNLIPIFSTILIWKYFDWKYKKS